MAGRVTSPPGRWLAVAGLFAAATVALTFPLVRHAGSVFPNDAGDPALNSWLLWWSTQRAPLTAAWWNAPMFFPTSDAMALSELLIGLLPITAPVQWLSGNPLLAYDVVFLASFALCGLSAYALVRELTRRRDAAVLAGLVFAFGPYRMNQLSHIQMLAYYWAPVALLGLHRYVDCCDRGAGPLRVSGASELLAGGPTGRFAAEAVRAPGWARIAWLAVFGLSWLMQALSNGYALFHFSILVVLWVVWFARDLKTIVPIGVALLCAALPLVPVMLKYRDVHERLHLERDINEIQRFSSDVAGVLSAPSSLAVWGGRLLPAQFETAQFPGITVAAILTVAAVLAFRRRVTTRSQSGYVRRIAAAIALSALAVALSALLFGPWSVGSLLTVGNFHKPFSIAVLAGVAWLAGSAWWNRAWRERSVPMFYAAAGLAMLLLSFGPAPVFLGRQVLYEPPYAWLMRLPGFDVLRVPARFGMLVLLCEAILVGLAFARWMPSVARRPSFAAIVLGLGVLADGWIRLPLVRAPASVDASFERAATAAKAVVELPPGEPVVDFPALYRATQHGRPIANGFSGFAPPHYLPFVFAIGHGYVDALTELAAHGPLAAVVDKSLHWSSGLESSISRLETARPIGSNEQWATFLVSGKPLPPVVLGPKLEPAAIRVNRQIQDAVRMSDGDIESAWGPGTPQDGGEEVVVDLGSARIVETVVLGMGAFSFGFPRELRIDVSADEQGWQTVWSGETSVRTVRAALAAPHTVPVTIGLGSASGRFVRLRQTGKDAVVPWWIAELGIHGR